MKKNAVNKALENDTHRRCVTSHSTPVIIAPPVLCRARFVLKNAYSSFKAQLTESP